MATTYGRTKSGVPITAQNFAVPRRTRLGVGVPDEAEEEGLGVLEEASAIGNSVGRVPNPSASIPSPYVNKQGQYDRDAILREFDNEARNRAQQPTNTGISGGGTPASTGRTKPQLSQEDILMGMHNRPWEEQAADEEQPAPGDNTDTGVDTGIDTGVDTSAESPAVMGNNPNSTNTWRYGDEAHQLRIDPSKFGFDLSRDQNPEKSAKDRTAMLMQAAGVDPGSFAGEGGKERAEEYFRTQIAPGLEEYGYEVVDVKGDQAYVRSWDGEGWVDFVTNAGGEPGTQTFAWQVQDGGGGEAAAMGGDAGLMAMLQGEEGGGDILAQIMAALNELQSGNNPYLTQALNEEFQGAA